ncbi:hypothetical protein FXW78_36230 [Rhodococcus opacus]|nr:hypothetical protein [Rhodococcus opacus]
MFQVSFALQNNAFPRSSSLGWNGPPSGVDREVSFRSVFTLAADGHQGLAGVVEYASDLFDRGTVESIAARYVRLLELIVADPRGGSRGTRSSSPTSASGFCGPGTTRAH